MNTKLYHKIRGVIGEKGTISRFAEVTGLPRVKIYDLIYRDVKPLDYYGDIKLIVIKLCEVLKCEPKEIFREEDLDHVKKERLLPTTAIEASHFKGITNDRLSRKLAAADARYDNITVYVRSNWTLI